ncbi:MAG: L-fuculose phosphate aldolase [Alphaproteobacteria bacterium MarineAlpha2_Bin1]|nr:MAG: L-fuculose phosphate aldolase [Alphaproteobacteria bacterium MarineAlpha2_Bin1]|tara:strand:- start:414 stop:1061 length:648 start_codon:yes stop_codon:yes gene_type:complete
MNEIDKKKLIVTYAQSFNSLNLSPLRSGNISIRHKQKSKDGLLITPSGKRYESIREKDIVFVDMSGKNYHKSNFPSSEFNFHLDLYKEKHCNAIIHCHSKYSLILSCFRKNIPSFHYMIALAGGNDIACAKYELFGTKDLSNSIIKAMINRKACLLSNHGQITIGNNIHEAFELAQEVEFLCECYYKCILIGQPEVISKNEMQKVLDKINNYKKN